MGVLYVSLALPSVGASRYEQWVSELCNMDLTRASISSQIMEPLVGAGIRYVYEKRPKVQSY